MFTIHVLECINQNCCVCKYRHWSLNSETARISWPCWTLPQSTFCLDSWVRGEQKADLKDGSWRCKRLFGHSAPLWDWLWSCWGNFGIFATRASMPGYPLVHVWNLLPAYKSCAWRTCKSLAVWEPQSNFVLDGCTCISVLIKILSMKDYCPSPFLYVIKSLEKREVFHFLGGSWGKTKHFWFVF